MPDIIKGHILITTETCACKDIAPIDRTNACPVCDWGLSVCINCGAAEIQLDQLCRKITMTDFTIEDRIKKALYIQLGLNLIINTDTRLPYKDATEIENDCALNTDLGCDSLDEIELIWEFEDTFGIDLDYTKLNWVTVQDVIDTVTVNI